MLLSFARISAALVFVSLIFSMPENSVKAEEKLPPPPPQLINGIPFAKFIETNGYREALRKSIINFEKEFGPCETATVKKRRTVVVPKIQVKFPDGGKVPQWIEVMDMMGCDKPFLRAVLVGQLKNSFKFLPLVPGTGISSVIDQWDVIKTLVPAEKLNAEKAGCGQDDKIRIHGHYLTDKKKDGSDLVWNENWKLMTCKGPKVIKVAFKTDGEGKTTFQILN